MFFRLHFVLLSLLLSWPLLAAQDFASNRFIFTLQKDQPAIHWQATKNRGLSGEMERICAKYEVRRIEPWLRSARPGDVFGATDFTKVYRVRLDKDKAAIPLKKLIAEFAALPEVLRASPEPLIRVASPRPPRIPNDPSYQLQWYLPRVGADFAWGLWEDSLPGNPDLLLGVVDTGLDYLHPEMEHISYINPAEDINGDGKFTVEDINGVDDDANGFIDDVRGWDFSEASGAYSGDNDIRPPNSGNGDILSHGTHVAGIMAAETDNAIGIAGMAYRAKIIATKQSRDDDLSDGYLYNAYDGILYCAKMGAEIINCSWGGTGYWQEAQDLINMVVQDYGAIIVCAAGNDNTNNDNQHFYPSDYQNTIAVAALNGNNQKAGFSNYGHVIDISAPGTAIYSTIHGSYASWQGTSMASPVVAGALGLLRSWFVDMPRQELIEVLYAGADSIDQFNPSYAGKLGAGCVNVYNPIARTLFPRILLSSYTYQVIADSSAGQIQPGDQVTLQLRLKNDTGWLDAGNLQVHLSTPADFITINDSLVQLGTMSAGSVRTVQQKQLTFSVDQDALLQPFQLQLRFTANEDGPHPYHESLTLNLAVSAHHNGFPQPAMVCRQPAAVIQIPDSGGSALVFAGGDNRLHVLTDSGQELNGFPVNYESFTNMPPIISDFDTDGKEDIVQANRRGDVFGWNAQGHLLFKMHMPNTIYGTASAADFDADGTPELVFGTMDKQLHILKTDSTELPGFPKATSSFINLGVALADVQSDSIPELIYATFDNQLHIMDITGAELVGWPVQLNSHIVQTPLVVLGENDVRIVVFTAEHALIIYNATGKELSSHSFSAAFSGPAALADLNEDNLPEILFPTEDAKLHVVDLQGNTVGAAPFNLTGIQRGAPLVYRERNGKPYILAATELGMLHIFSLDGSNLTHYPAKYPADFMATPQLLDIDMDHNLEISCSGSAGMYVFDLPIEAQGSGWQTSGGDLMRSNAYRSDALLAIDEPKEAVAQSVQLLQNYPNPFNPQTTIRYRLGQDTRIELSIYNVLGQRVSIVDQGLRTAGLHSISWQGRNLASGVYLLRLRTAGGTEKTRKVLYLQ